MQGQARYVALGLAVLVLCVMQLPVSAGAQTTPGKAPKPAKPTTEDKKAPTAPAGQAEEKKEGESLQPTADPQAAKAGTKEAEPPKVSSIGELVSMAGMTRMPEKPFASEKETKARAAKSPMSFEALRSGVGVKGGPTRLSGRRAVARGTVVSKVPVGTAMTQVLLADEKDSRRIAYLITLPRGDENEFEVGNKAEITGVFGQAIWRPGYKGTLLTMLGRGLDKWQDEGMSLQDLAATYLRPNPATEAASADAKGKSGWEAWHLYGQVEKDGSGTMYLARTDGKKLYAQDGQLVEPGIRVLKVLKEAVTLRIDNREVVMRPW